MEALTLEQAAALVKLQLRNQLSDDPQYQAWILRN
jgi:hypothetical protein